MIRQQHEFLDKFQIRKAMNAYTDMEYVRLTYPGVGELIANSTK